MANNSDLSQRFQNIDEPAAYKARRLELKKVDTRNFVVEFGDSEAQCAVDLTKSELESLLKQPAPPSRNTRWINFWGGDLQEDLIRTVVAHYGISPRLIALLTSKASDKKTTVQVKPKSEEVGRATASIPSQGHKSIIHDAEKGDSGSSIDPQETVSREPKNFTTTTLGEVVDDIWHFCSVDWGKGYLHIGYNTLFSVPGLEITTEPDKPPGKRIWTSLTLCEDGTVISISEKPFPNGQIYPEMVSVVRNHVLNVFHHLSKVSKTSGHETSLLAVNIRNFDHNPTASKPSSSIESASLLFYYLFDDWTSAYSLAARSNHPFGEKLTQLRKDMFDKARVDLIQLLHVTGRQLAALKRIYQSLELIISRILQRQRLLDEDSRRTARIFGDSFHRTNTDDHDNQDPTHTFDPSLSRDHDGSIGVRLSASSIVRLERLLDRLRLYALSEIDECMAEKEALVLMNFNLIALKESQAVEKLTRITVVLAKGTLLFLPVSLMTAYFSTQLRDIQNAYTTRTYWLSFMIVIIVSILLLAGFQVASDNVEGRTIYRSLTRTAWARAKRKRT